MLYFAHISARGGVCLSPENGVDNVFRVLETNKQTNATIVLGRYAARPEALEAWLNVDHAHLWHHLEEDENEGAQSLSA
jgi:hypothetical protein